MKASPWSWHRQLQKRVALKRSPQPYLAIGLISTLLAFLGFGILLSLTPCVFPMIPIISGMLARSGGELSLGRSFVLSAAYVLAMAAAYGTLGVFAAWSGENLQAALQTPAAIIAMSLVFVALSLSMFGLYELQLPQSWTSRLAETAGNKGSVGGSAALGFGSALIVGPCVTPPLAAALVYVAQTGQVLRGSLALFALGLGMGLPSSPSACSAPRCFRVRERGSRASSISSASSSSRLRFGCLARHAGSVGGSDMGRAFSRGRWLLRLRSCLCAIAPPLSLRCGIDWCLEHRSMGARSWSVPDRNL